MTLAEAVRDFLRDPTHDDKCPRSWAPTRDCECGLDDRLEPLRAALAALDAPVEWTLLPPVSAGCWSATLSDGRELRASNGSWMLWSDANESCEVSKKLASGYAPTIEAAKRAAEFIAGVGVK